MRNPSSFCRRLLLWLLAAQLLNLSLCGDVYQDVSRYNASVDPTESVVEWLVEMHCGQQSGFDYPHYMDTHKGPAKTMHWHVAKLYYSLHTGHSVRFLPALRLTHTLLFSRFADRSLDRPPQIG